MRRFILFVAVACITVQALNCTWQQNVDYDESLHPKNVPAADTKEECCALCAANTTCSVAVFSPALQKCWLKPKKNPVPVYKEGVIACWPQGNGPIPPNPPSTAPIESPTPSALKYSVFLTFESKVAVVSHINKAGDGETPCKATFNPAWLPKSPGLDATGLLVRVSGCPADFGGANDHIMYIPCDTSGKCGNLSKVMSLEPGSEDPRVVLVGDTYYNFYYAPGVGEYTVKLARTKTPLNASSWEHVVTLPWHRNGCLMLKDKPPHYVLYGEGNIGLATTNDLKTFSVVDPQYIKPLGVELNEVKLEASTPLVQLSTGDWLHFYAAATPGWDPPLHGNYTVGYVVLNDDDPPVIIQRSTKHIMIPKYPYQLGTDGWPWTRKDVIFLTSVVPTGNKDEFRLWFGAADANVGTALVQVDLIKNY